MLVKNPITSFLYTFGYNGIENIHEFWLDNKEGITTSYKKINKKKDVQEDLIAFKFKVRWGSSFGMFIRLGIDKLFRVASDGDLDFGTVNVRYGKRYLGIEDFSRRTTEDKVWQEYMDLRGISILKKDLKNSIVKNVNFSYGAFDSCKFTNVTFINCQFEGTSFCDARLIDCHFLSTCLLKDNDFSRALIDSTFECDVLGPVIRYPRLWQIPSYKDKRPQGDKRFLKYTHIRNISISTMSDDEKLKRFVGKRV